MLLRHIPIVGFGFNGLKRVILLVNDKERSGDPKKFDNIELQDLIDEIPAQSRKELSDSLALDESTVSETLK